MQGAFFIQRAAAIKGDSVAVLGGLLNDFNKLCFLEDLLKALNPGVVSDLLRGANLRVEQSAHFRRSSRGDDYNNPANTCVQQFPYQVDYGRHSSQGEKFLRHYLAGRPHSGG